MPALERVNFSLGATATLAAAGCWALLGPFSQLAGDSPIEIAFWRALFGGACFLVYGISLEQEQLKLMLSKRSAKQHVLTTLSLVGLSLYGVVAYYWSYQVAISEIGIGLGSVLLYTAPFWVAIVDLVVCRKQSSRRAQLLRLTAGFACVIGVSAIALPTLDDSPLTLLGLACGLLAGLCYASYYFLDYLTLGPIPKPILLGVGMLLGAAALSPSAQFDKTVDTWLWLSLIGIVSTFAAYTLLMYATRRLGPTLTASVATMEPVIAVAFGVIFFDEMLFWNQWIGFIIVIGAAVLAAIARQHAVRQEPPHGDSK